MKKVVEYKVVFGERRMFSEDLTPKVNSMIAHGWQPMGGVAVDTRSNPNTLIQAMVKYEEDKPE